MSDPLAPAGNESDEDDEDDEGSPDWVIANGVRIEADLDVRVDGDSLRVRSSDGRIDVFAERLAAVRSLAALRDVVPDRLPDSVGDALKAVPVGVHVRGVEVARVDPGVPPGPLARALGVAPARVNVRGLVRVLAGRRR